MTFVATAQSVVSVARERNVTLLAAALAYYAFVSVVPLLVLALVVGSLLGGEALAESIVRRVQDLSPSAQRLVRRALTAERGRTGAGIVSLLALVWSALKVFRALNQSFAEIYETIREPSLLDQVRNGLVAMAVIGLALGLLVSVGVVVGTRLAQMLPFGGVLGFVGLLVGLVVVFLPVYYVMPPVETSVRSVLPGTAVAAVGFVVLHVLFVTFVANAAQYQAYGVLGVVLLFVTWLYAAGVVMLVGATVNAVLWASTTATTADRPTAQRS